MKTLRFIAATVALLGGVSAFATNARVESMGKNSRFIMDDVSIFDNPANINLYPNFLIGELGIYTYPEGSVGPGENRDPMNPWFGGIFSLDIGGGNSLSIAGVLNRKDERLFKYFPDRISTAPVNQQLIANGTGKSAPDPVTNFDGFLGANFNNKAFGVHIYWAHQDGMFDNGVLSPDAFVSAFQLDLGGNIEISSNLSMEAAGGIARIQYGPADRSLFDSDLISGFAHARVFSRVQAINGHLIPVAHFRTMNAPGREELDWGGGCGADAAFDRGFFWLGLEFFYNHQKADENWVQDREGVSTFHDVKGDKGLAGDITKLSQIGGTISFGIERNIWWDWFVLRVGGQKTVAYADYKAAKNNPRSILCPDKETGCSKDGNYFVSNPINDGTRDDNVGFGIGINIEEKLKVDATISEDFVFRNPFQGGGRLISRVSATYSF